MKRILASIICLCIFGVFSHACAEISRIDAECRSIQKNIESFELATVPITGHSTEGGEAKVYRDSNGEIRLLIIHLYFESGRMIEKFYFNDNSIIFAKYQYFRYNAPFYVTSEVVNEIGGEPFDPERTKETEEKFYFDHNKMVQWSNEKSELVVPSSQKFKERELKVIEELDAFMAKAKET